MDGYIQIELGEKNVGLKFTMWAIEEMNRLQNEKPESVVWKSVSLVYAGYLNNCRHKRVEPEYTLQDIELFVDDFYSTAEGTKLMEDISKALTSSYLFKNLTGQDLDEETKKKRQIGNGSRKLPLEKSV